MCWHVTPEIMAIPAVTAFLSCVATGERDEDAGQVRRSASPLGAALSCRWSGPEAGGPLQTPELLGDLGGAAGVFVLRELFELHIVSLWFSESLTLR